MGKESILCVAIHVNDGVKHDFQPKNIETGYVVCGYRHGNCYNVIGSLIADSPEKKVGLEKFFDENGRLSEGFITSLNRYVDRKEAWVLAKVNNQIQYGLVVSDNGDDSILISENLY